MEVKIIPVGETAPAPSSGRLVAVVIDALRASVTIATALDLGAEKVVPVTSLEEALKLKQGNRVLIAGERGGKWVEGFDLGNSPGQLKENAERLRGATLVLTTSNGTGTIHRASACQEVVIGSLPNLSVTVKKTYFLAGRHRADIALFPAGWLGQEAEEDLYTAARIGRGLTTLGAAFNPAPEVERLLDWEARDLFMECEAGQRLMGLGYREDALACAQVDTCGIVPVYRDGALRAG